MNKTINFSEMGLGYRETERLIAFMHWFQTENLQNCNAQSFDFGYDVKYDEPFVNSGLNTLYALDFDIVYNEELVKYENDF